MTDFDTFWAQYPRRVGKRTARAAFDKAQKRGMPPISNVMVSLLLQMCSEQWTKDGGKYIPHPSTWLNRDGWEDEVIELTEHDNNAVVNLPTKEELERDARSWGER